MSRMRAVALVLAVVPALLVAPVGAANEAPRLTFVSAPDMWNSDIGDASRAPFWDGGENSTNVFYETATAKVFDNLTRHDPDFALVAGDMVEGHWYGDSDNRGIFGPVATHRQRRTAVANAGATYYPQWIDAWRSRGVPVHTAVGDHEIGDNPWPANGAKARLFRAFKKTWSDHFTVPGGTFRYSNRPVGTRFERSAYAIRRGPVLVVTVDVFNQHADTTVHAEVVNGQLDWVQRVLASARADRTIEYVIVQGHTPAVTPVRSHRSSAMVLEQGTSSAFWKLLAKYQVDLYLAGEVHATTAGNYGGVEQVAHGGIIGYGEHMSYLVGEVYADRLELKLMTAPVTTLSPPDQKLWQVTTKRPSLAVGVGDYSYAGGLTISRDGDESNRTGIFAPYSGLPPS